MSDAETKYCCEKFQENADCFEQQVDGKAWFIVVEEFFALIGILYCPFCGKKLPVRDDNASLIGLPLGKD